MRLTVISLLIAGVAGCGPTNPIRKAAEQGDADAQYRLGSMYYRGYNKDIDKDDVEAVKWYRKAAEQGLAEAQFALGYMYHSGYGVPKDDGEAAKWYLNAAEQGVSGAQCNLAQMYYKGEGVPKDSVEAYALYLLAAANGDGLAKQLLRGRTPDQLAEAQKRATELTEKINANKAKHSPVHQREYVPAGSEN